MSEELKKAILNQKPTKEQQDAIFSEDKEFILRSAPGSGKTWTSCRRFIWRGSNWEYSSGGLALLSFTNTAVNEFRGAAKGVGKVDLLSEPNYIGTIDSFIERFVITPFGHKLHNLQERPKLLLDQPKGLQNNKFKAWKPISHGRNMPVHAYDITPVVSDDDVKFTYQGAELSINQNNPVIELFKAGYYTHSQRLFFACLLLAENEHVLNLLARRFPEIIIDEAQDTNQWVLMLLDSLRKAGTKITLIGDPDQCIYEFSQAEPKSLENKKNEWSISELPLSKSFRCNNRIANAAKNISGNAVFTGCGDDPNQFRKAYIFRESDITRYSNSIQAFNTKLNDCDIHTEHSKILCRGHDQLQKIKGESRYLNLQGVTKQIANACFYRDVIKEYKISYDTFVLALKQLTAEEEFWIYFDENQEQEEVISLRITIWKFLKSNTQLPPISNNLNQWIAILKTNIVKLIADLQLSISGNIGSKIRVNGISAEDRNFPLFEEETSLPVIRQETIHQVKGETIEGVLVLGSTKFFNKVVTSTNNNESSEERRLAYVAMSRAKHLLIIGLPNSHYDKHRDTWLKWGFNEL